MGCDVSDGWRELTRAERGLRRKLGGGWSTGQLDDASGPLTGFSVDCGVMRGRATSRVVEGLPGLFR